MFRHNLEQFAIAIDQVLGVVVSACFREKGWADMTLSATAYRWERRRVRAYPRKIIDAFFFWQKEHCYNSYVSELQRFHFPPEVRFKKRGVEKCEK